jgi:hypothetical protein
VSELAETAKYKTKLSYEDDLPLPKQTWLPGWKMGPLHTEEFALWPSGSKEALIAATSKTLPCMLGGPNIWLTQEEEEEDSKNMLRSCVTVNIGTRGMFKV